MQQKEAGPKEGRGSGTDMAAGNKKPAEKTKVPIRGLLVETKPKKPGKTRAKKNGNGISPVFPEHLSSAVPPALLGDIHSLIESTRVRVATGVNAELVMLHWHIGHRLGEVIRGEEQGVYGKRIVELVAGDLTAAYGRGFSAKSLFHMIRFAGAYGDETIVSTLSRQLSWSHFLDLIYIEETLKRDFYTEICRLERWSVRTLRAKLDGMLYERTALSKKPDELMRKELAALRAEDRMTPDLVFRDHYLLDFLGLSDTYSERDLEDSIIREMERFITELGTDFSFVARQKRITVDHEDFYIDLIFYHRRLRCLIVIDLKLGVFRPADMGQIELYLRWLNKYDRQPGEESPLGLILCSGRSTERIELLQLEERGIRVAEYLTELPPREVLEQKLKSAVAIARERLAARTAGKSGKAKKGKMRPTGDGT
ncbi:MAG: PDDEXK nuclease domain-containing protein [Methanoregula sp.]|nr:PDDEXK nuclease domain-containing protein [Methanoregula sp.]